MVQHLLIGGGRDDDPGHHHRVDEVIGGVGEPPGIGRGGDDLRTLVRAAVEVDPPQGDAAGEGRDERGDRGGGHLLPYRQGLADHDDRLTQGDDDERLAPLGEVAARDRPLLAGGPSHPRGIEADPVAEQVDPEGSEPHQLPGMAAHEGSGDPDTAAGHRPERDPYEDPAEPLPPPRDRDERGPADLHQHVGAGHDQPAGPERPGQGRRQHQAHQHQDDEHEPDRYPPGVQVVRRPGRVDPRPPHQREQQRGLQRALHGRQGEQMVRHLGDGEDVHQVEEQLDVGDPLLAGMVLQQAARLPAPCPGRVANWPCHRRDVTVPGRRDLAAVLATGLAV